MNLKKKEWMILAHKQSKKSLHGKGLWIYTKKKKMRLWQLAGMDPAEIVVPFINAEIDSLWTQHELW